MLQILFGMVVTLFAVAFLGCIIAVFTVLAIAAFGGL